MQDSDRYRFAVIVKDLADALRETLDRGEVDVYFRGLKPYDIEFVTAAAGQLASQAGEHGGSYFPRLPEWVAMVNQVVYLRKTQMQRHLDDLHRHGQVLCLACEDTKFSRVEGTDRVERCACQDLRQLELLGRRPSQAVPMIDVPMAPAYDDREQKDALATLKTIEQKTGKRVGLRGFPT